MRTASENAKIIYPELSYQIMKHVFEVHNQLGPGFSENIYEEALAYEFGMNGIEFERQKSIQLSYKGRIVGSYRLDIVVDQKIILELKAVTALNELFKAQLLSYLKATGLRLGILINFGSLKVETDRIVG